MNYLVKFFTIFLLGISLSIFKISAKEIVTDNGNLVVSDEIAKKYSELVDLIVATESMNYTEKQYWFDILPGMDGDQLDRLFKILDTERKKLIALEKKYQKEIEVLNRKHLREHSRASIEEKLKSASDSMSKEVLVLVAMEGRTPAFIIKNYSDLADDENILTPEEYKNFGKSNVISEIDNLIFLKHVENLIDHKKLYEASYPKEMIDSYFDHAVPIAKNLKSDELLFKISKISSKHREIVLLASGKFSKVAKDRYEESLLSNNVISNIIWIDGVGRHLTYLRGNDECFDYCGKLLKLLDSAVRKNFEEIENSFRHRIKKKSSSAPYIPLYLDFIITFNPDINLEAILSLKNSLLKIEKSTEINTGEDTRWVNLLKENYFSGKGKITYVGIEQERVKKLETEDFVGNFALEGKLLESGVFAAIASIKEGDNVFALDTLIDLVDVGAARSSPAYGYIEHDMRDFLIKTLGSNNFRIRGARKLAASYVIDDNSAPAEHRNKYAIVVGISDYEKLPGEVSKNRQLEELVDLKYAHNDARAFKEEFLENSNVSGGDWKVSLLINSDATMANVRGEISRILDKAEEDDLVYIFFSGHGRSVDLNGDETFLMTTDAGQNDLYIGIDLNWLERAIRKTKAVHVVAFIDACRSGNNASAKGVRNMKADFINRHQELQGQTKVIFSSGSGSQVSYEDPKSKRGFFTHYLIKALALGEAPELHNDGMVGLYEAERYVSEEVRKATKGSQKPQVPTAANFGKSVFFPLALR